MTDKTMAWHYTINARAVLIFSEGVIRPATAAVPAGEIPVVWFSTRQHWEPTANKGAIDDNGQRVRLTMKQTLDRGGGGWRFGLPTERLLYWRKLIIAAQIVRAHARALEYTARKARQ